MDCETCALYSYDDDYEDYVCSADMDEDDVYRIMSSKHEACPFYRDGDEYKVVKKQI